MQMYTFFQSAVGLVMKIFTVIILYFVSYKEYILHILNIYCRYLKKQDHKVLLKWLHYTASK